MEMKAFRFDTLHCSWLRHYTYTYPATANPSDNGNQYHHSWMCWAEKRSHMLHAPPGIEIALELTGLMTRDKSNKKHIETHAMLCYRNELMDWLIDLIMWYMHIVIEITLLVVIGNYTATGGEYNILVLVLLPNLTQTIAQVQSAWCKEATNVTLFTWLIVNPQLSVLMPGAPNMHKLLDQCCVNLCCLLQCLFNIASILCACRAVWWLY